LGGVFHVRAGHGNGVERFGQNCSEIFVRRVHLNLAAQAPRLPQSAWLDWLPGWLPDFQRQVDTETRQSDVSVLRLAAPLTGFRTDAGRTMDQPDGGLNLVAMLASGPGPP
jgi:hypothetical protein